MNKKIYLFCSLGMTTSFLASKMQNIANKKKLSIEVKAFAYTEIEKIVKQQKPDYILLGPQVKNFLKEAQEKFNGKIAIDVINSVDYVAMNGEKILNTTINMMKDWESK